MQNRAAQLLSSLVESSPLRHARFRLFYLGNVGTALGYTMQATVAAWLMATLTPSAFMVALVQTASTAPALLFGLIAGALADIVDRQRLLLITQVLLLIGTVLLGVAALVGVVGPSSLLALTFLIGAAFTYYQPAQQAMINDLVPRVELPRAVALGAVGFNASRAVGPAIAGALTAALGSGNALLASSLCFLVMIVALRGWGATTHAVPGVPETVVSGVMSGLRYARHSPPLRALIVRNLSFCVCASALWALMPVVARDQFGLGAGGFGLLLGSFGSGAVIGALSIPRHLQRMSLNRVVTIGVVLWVVATLLLAATTLIAAAIVAIAAAGAAWVTVLASLTAGTQSSAPAWVRARAVAMNLVAVQAGLASGGIIWGWVASVGGIRLAIAASAALAIVLLVASYRVRVTLGEEADVTPGVQLPDLTISAEPMPDDGPVLIQIEYRIDAANREAFLQLIHSLEPTRRRNGASSWRVFRDLGEEGRFVERYIIASWAEYVRLRARATVADRQLQQQVAKLQQPDIPIRISRLIGVDVDEDDGARADAKE